MTAADVFIKYTAQPWSCKDFDEGECRQQILHNLQEQYNTVYDCAFLQPQHCGGQEGHLLAAYHSGDVRLFNWRHVCSTWLAGRATQQPQQHEQLSWRAHEGPVYALALLQLGGTHLLATAGGDGHVKLWRLADVLQAAADAAAAATAAAADGGAGAPHANAAAAVAAAAEGRLRPVADVLLPPLQNPLGFSAGGQPAAQALAVDTQQQQLFIGSSDGGIHAWRLPRLDVGSTASSGEGQQLTAGAAAALALAPLQGHAAGVLGLDVCPARNQLASASEDGTVRLWDCASLACLQAINPWQEQVLPLDEPQEVMRGARCPGCLCVRWDDGGNWLLTGHADGCLTLWSVMLGSGARRKELKRPDGAKVVPQVLLVTPGVTYVGGSDSRLHQYSFNLELLQSFEVAPESVFGVALDAGSGMLAVCGSRGCLDLLGTDGQALGCVRPPPSLLMPPQQPQKQQGGGGAAVVAAG